MDPGHGRCAHRVALHCRGRRHHRQSKRDAARAQTLVAQSRQLVAEVSSIKDTQPDLASQLLVEAYRLSPTTEAAGALIESNALPRVIHGRGTARAAAYTTASLSG